MFCGSIPFGIVCAIGFESIFRISCAVASIEINRIALFDRDRIRRFGIVNMLSSTSVISLLAK